MRVSSLLLVLGGVSTVACSEMEDLRLLVDALREQNARLEEHVYTAVSSLRVEFSKLQRECNLLAAKQQHAGAKLESLTAERRLPSAVSTRRLSLSSGTCADPSDARLLVEGVCSCTGGLLVEGRNVTQELNELQAALIGPNTTVVASSDINCTTLESPFVVGSITEDAVSLHTPRGVAVSPYGTYAYVVSVSSDTLAVVDVGTEPTHPAVVGSIADNITMKYSNAVATSPDGKYVYAVGRESDSLAVVDVATNVTHPVVVGSVTDATSLDNPVAIALSPNGRYAYVTGYVSDSFSVVDVGTDPSNPIIVGTFAGNATLLNGAFGVAVSPPPVTDRPCAISLRSLKNGEIISATK